MRREKLTVNYIGVDGYKWPLSNPLDGGGSEGVWLDKKHVGLITDTPVETIWESSAGQIGATYRGLNFGPREISFPVMILDSPERSWQSVDSRWRNSWSYREDGEIEVIAPNGGVRRLKARLFKTPEQQLEDDSGQNRRGTKMLMHIKAGDPLWSSLTTSDVWRFNGIDYMGSVTVANPTDMPMYLKWTVTGPASIILPDFSFETRDGWAGSEHRDRRIVLPHLKVGWDALVDTDPVSEQLAVLGKPNFWMMLNQPFLYEVPPRTPPTELPVVVNPVPLLPEVWHRLAIPFDIPVEALVQIAQRLTTLLAPLGTDTVLSWTPERLAEEIDAAIRWVLPNFVGEWVYWLLEVLSIRTLGEVISEAWGSVNNMAGAGVQVRMEHKWTRPYGLD